MHRRAFLNTLGGLLALPLGTEAQRPGKVYRVGYIGPTPVATIVSDPAQYFNSFRREMGQRGYVEGQDLVLELRSVEGRLDRVPEIVGELVRLNADVIVAVSAPVIQAARQATKTIPIVMVGVGDPVGTGFVVSLARPGGNITGLSQLSPELSAKRLDLLKDVVPGVSRVAILWNPSNPSNAPQLEAMKVVAQALGMQLQLLDVRGPRDVESGFQAATRGRAGALVTLDDLLIYTRRTQIVALAPISETCTGKRPFSSTRS